ncbi:MAG: MBL fold metallo-hydrolase [Clostridia bacterium]|nr:MBL fold metallo-hydrolase [Clostridia bacterium]
MNTFLSSVLRLSVPYGTAFLWWLGQMGLLMKIGNTVLCVDYFASERQDRQVPPPIPAEELSGVDLILGTHDHLDHIDHAAWRIWAHTCPEAKFVFPALHEPGILADGIPQDRCLGLTDGKSVLFRDVTVHAVAAAHEFLDPDPETGFYPCLQYIIEGNGVRIYHAGDTLRYEGMLPRLLSFGPPDAALLPINGRDGRRYRRNCIGNMTFQEAADLAGELSPGLVIPGHWDMFRDNPGDPAAFADYLEAKYAGRVPVRIPRYLEEIRVGSKAT